MGLFDFLKKEKVPDELPDLAVDETEPKAEETPESAPTENVSNSSENNDKNENASDNKDGGMDDADKEFEEKLEEEDTPKDIDSGEEEEQKEPEEPPAEASSSDADEGEEPKREDSRDGAYAEQIKSAVESESSGVPSKSFFEELQQNITEELSDLNNLEDWYNNKFMSKSVVSDMRNYWEHQKTNTILDSLGKNFKERMAEKTKRLQELEKEWQNIYFDLIEKEEEIKDEEAELKKLLSEFLEVCKRKKERLGDNEQESKEEGTEEE